MGAKSDPTGPPMEAGCTRSAGAKRRTPSEAQRVAPRRGGTRGERRPPRRRGSQTTPARQRCPYAGSPIRPHVSDRHAVRRRDGAAGSVERSGIERGPASRGDAGHLQSRRDCALPAWRYIVDDVTFRVYSLIGMRGIIIARGSHVRTEDFVTIGSAVLLRLALRPIGNLGCPHD